jgi:uncharacterized protein YidB (DUF937 family)
LIVESSGIHEQTNQEEDMGLMDILNGMQNGPRGQRLPPAGNAPESGGTSPIMMALLGLLTYKAVKHIGGQPAGPGAQGRPTSGPPTGSAGQDRPTSAPSTGTVQARTPSGGPADIFGGLFGGGPSSAKPVGSNPMPGGLGSLLGGAAAGSVLSGGLGSLINDLQKSGQGRVAQSWINRGPNEEIAPADLRKALGSDTLDALAKQTGLSRDELLEGLSQNLPDLIDKLTPNGRLPTEEEASRMM